ncbi:MAG TPA: NAD(P)-dependent oxidoreductase [Candidatus Lokiarchaeia archaeon]|nr:NAD(P)-dependent oxidoreductase [Candidatus Lokiarchaeia archaeon]
MNILVTGAFGNIGTRTVRELLQRGEHTVACFDLKTAKNLKTAKTFGNQIELFWGDLLELDSLKSAVVGRDVVIHLAAIIPPRAEKEPEYTQQVNVNGTQTVVNLLSALDPPPRLLFCSSVSVFGDTFNLPPPRTVTDPLYPTDVYARSKVACEEIIHKSGLNAVIFRLGAATPPEMSSNDSMMFTIRLDSRMEFVHPDDVARAIANALVCDEVWGNTYLIGGGKDCQILFRDFFNGIMTAVGIGMLPDAAFGDQPFYIDWLDTEESERLLHYQQKTFRDFLQELKKAMGHKTIIIKMMRPLIRCMLLNTSPYWKTRNK